MGNSPGPVNSPHKGPVTRKMLPFDDVIMVKDVYDLTMLFSYFPSKSNHAYDIFINGVYHISITFTLSDFEIYLGRVV